MLRINALEDLVAHSKLKGKIFKRKALDANKLYGLGCLGVAGLIQFYFPLVAFKLGSTLTTLTLTGAYLGAMYKL
jgi:hypothetical protein